MKICRKFSGKNSAGRGFGRVLAVGTAIWLFVLSGAFAANPFFVPLGIDFSPYMVGQNPSAGTLSLKLIKWPAV